MTPPPGIDERTDDDRGVDRRAATHYPRSAMPNHKIEEQYFDVLQNIETAIVTAYQDNPNLLDLDVMDALDALIRHYSREEQGAGSPASRLSDPAQRVHDLSKGMCEWRLGRQPLNAGHPAADRPPTGETSIAEIVLCLKRIRKSVRLWNWQGGRQGYLDYVRQFLGDAARRLGA